MKIKKKFISVLLCAMFILSMGISAAAAEIEPRIDFTGTDRYFNIDLPNYYQNHGFQYRQKENGTALGSIYLTSKTSSCSGITAWFQNSSGSIITDFKTVSSLNTRYYLIYSKDYAQGSSVRLVVEDQDNTYIGHHNAKGYVNYN